MTKRGKFLSLAIIGVSMGCLIKIGYDLGYAFGTILVTETED